jgi:hypothetical protein
MDPTSPAKTVLDEAITWAGITRRKRPVVTILFAYDGSESADASISAAGNKAGWKEERRLQSQRPRLMIRSATRPVQPVWCDAPRPAPVSPWKYSWNGISPCHAGSRCISS